MFVNEATGLRVMFLILFVWADSTALPKSYDCTGWMPLCQMLTHWGRETHICVSEHANIGSDNGLSPYRRQAIIWTNAGILLIEPVGTNFNEILIEIHTFSFKRMHFKVSSGKWRPFCLGLNVLIWMSPITIALHHALVTCLYYQ